MARQMAKVKGAHGLVMPVAIEAWWFFPSFLMVNERCERHAIADRLGLWGWGRWTVAACGATAKKFRLHLVGKAPAIRIRAACISADLRTYAAQGPRGSAAWGRLGWAFFY